MKKYTDPFGDFLCLHCKTVISADPQLSGVYNRNHCPYCLWSRHMDLYQPGDRLCACKSVMQPVALTLKQQKKKYGSQQGELMLVHLCTGCRQISMNRIAADDVPQNVFSLFVASLRLDDAVKMLLLGSGVQPLCGRDANMVRARLFGWAGVHPAGDTLHYEYGEKYHEQETAGY